MTTTDPDIPDVAVFPQENGGVTVYTERDYIVLSSAELRVLVALLANLGTP